MNVKGASPYNTFSELLFHVEVHHQMLPRPLRVPRLSVIQEVPPTHPTTQYSSNPSRASCTKYPYSPTRQMPRRTRLANLRHEKVVVKEAIRKGHKSTALDTTADYYLKMTGDTTAMAISWSSPLGENRRISPQMPNSAPLNLPNLFTIGCHLGKGKARKTTQNRKQGGHLLPRPASS